jgi:hypothetical protein
MIVVLTVAPEREAILVLTALTGKAMLPVALAVAETSVAWLNHVAFELYNAADAYAAGSSTLN